MERSARRVTARPATALLTATALALAASPAPAAQDSRRIVAIADIHGALGNFTAIMQEVGLLDDDLHWSGGDAILVQTGDILDRGPDVRAALDLLMRLQEEAPRAGGEVIVALGNHEAMNLVGHWRDTTPDDSAAFVDEHSEQRRDDAWDEWRDMRRELAEKLGAGSPRFDREAWDEAHPLGWFERMDAFGPEGRYGRWLRSLPTAVRIDNLLFMHAGLNPEYGDLSAEQINERVFEELRRFDDTKQLMVDAGLITPHADLVEMITSADDMLVTMVRRLEETGAQLDAAGQRLARALGWMIGYADWQLLTRDGLLWFRGLARWPEKEHAQEVADLLERQRIDHIIVGHTVQLDGEIRTRFDGGVFLADTGMLTEVYSGRPAALEIVDGTFTARYVGERKVLLAPEVLSIPDAVAPPAPALRTGGAARRVPASWPLAAPPRASSQGRVWTGPDGAPLPLSSDDEVLEFLSTAQVTAVEKLDSGKTGPLRVALEKHGVQARAVFHDVDVHRDQVRIGERFHAVFRDSWRAQIAAYRLARLLGLENVPPTVRRTIGEQTGSLQLWLEQEGLRTNLARVQAREYPRDVEAWLAQEWQMQVFDALIFNDDRHAENILVDSNWRLWMVDHTRAFQSDPSIRDPETLNRIDRRLLEALRELERDQVEAALDELLEPDQINALMARRRAILEHFDRLIDILGEDAVVYDRSGTPRGTLIGERVA
jgi:hypothetical protein